MELRLEIDRRIPVEYVNWVITGDKIAILGFRNRLFDYYNRINILVSASPTKIKMLKPELSSITLTGIMPNSIKSRASTCFKNRSFSSLSSATDEEDDCCNISANEAARLPGEPLAGTPNPRYWNENFQVNSFVEIISENARRLMRYQLFHFFACLSVYRVHCRHLTPRIKYWSYPPAPFHRVIYAVNYVPEH